MPKPVPYSYQLWDQTSWMNMNVHQYLSILSLFAYLFLSYNNHPIPIITIITTNNKTTVVIILLIFSDLSTIKICWSSQDLKASLRMLRNRRTVQWFIKAIGSNLTSWIIEKREYHIYINQNVILLSLDMFIEIMVIISKYLQESWSEHKIASKNIIMVI